MGASRRRLPCALWGVLYFAFSADARADTNGILFLGVFQKNVPHEGARRAVIKRMERMGEQLLAIERLTVSERGCRSQECLTKLATDRNADFILGGDLRLIEARTFSISMWLWDARAGKLREGSATPCIACDEDTLANAVSTATGQILEQRRGPSKPREPPTPLPPPISVTPPAPPVGEKPPAPPRFSRGHLIAIGALAAGTLTALGASIFFSTVTMRGDLCSNQPPPPAAPHLCNYSPILQGVGWSATGVLATGLVLSIALP